jgi:hypothetical protein
MAGQNHCFFGPIKPLQKKWEKKKNAGGEKRIFITRDVVSSL